MTKADPIKHTERTLAGFVAEKVADDSTFNRAALRSSLWFMVDRIAEKLTRGGTWIVQRGEPQWDLADAALERATEEGAPILLLGTTLLFIAYFERLAAVRKSFALPTGSRAMDTGG